ncbi:hypothetical protein Tco_0708532 [Tanacetum coccineum]
MAQPQRQADVHQDELCPPNKCYALMDANKIIDLDNPLSPSNFKTTGLVQPRQTLCKMFSRCLTTRVTGFDQPRLQIMQMMYCFVNNVHLDYADLLWEGLHYSLEHPSTLIPYPRFIKLIINVTDEMKLTENYRMYAAVFEVDVPTTQLCIPPRRSTRLTPPTPMPTTAEADDIIIQDTIQLSLVEQKSHDDFEAKHNKEKVKEQLMAEEIERTTVEGIKRTEDESSNGMIMTLEKKGVKGMEA